MAKANTSRATHSAVGRATGRFSRHFSRSMSLGRTGRFLRQQLWVWPVAAAIILGASGWWVSHAVESAMRQQRVNELTTILNADVKALQSWMSEQRTDAEQITGDAQIAPLVEELLKLAADPVDRERNLILSKAQNELRSIVKHHTEQCEFSGFMVVDLNGLVIASDLDPPVGKTLDGYRKEFFERVLSEGSAVSKPYRSPLLLTDEKGRMRADLPTMFTAAAIKGKDGRPLAALGLRIRPEAEFTKILQIARTGESGETYAFDNDGLLLSESRFNEQLKQVGLLADLPESQSVLTVELRDPGVDMMDGKRPKLRRPLQPFTQMADEAIAGRDGHDADGFRDYRGVEVVGAWRWLPECEFGVGTQIDVAESFAPLYILRRAFRVLTGLLILSGFIIYGAMIYMARQQRELQKATLAAKQLGQYALEDKLGAGGMGTVYKARHAMLRRPTAIKLLNIDKSSDAAIARFEREVQLTGALTHPNTVAVFDYGRTPDGIFYYAMEYLEGVDLNELVTRFGKIPESRMLYILGQVCGSLAEAHAAGLVHRDVKPANIFLTRRGGMDDFVKVLDFGLAKAFEGENLSNVTAANVVTGTPLYISPEAVREPEKVDARADVYAIGAVAYYLLTGQPVFDGPTVMEICMKHVQETPQRPSERFSMVVDPKLESVIMQCLEKRPADRPADAAAILAKFQKCEAWGQWTAAIASAWWAEHHSKTVAVSTSPPTINSPLTTAAVERVNTTMDYQEGD